MTMHNNKGIQELKRSVSKLHDHCRNYEDSYDPLMAVDVITKLLFVKLTDERTNDKGRRWFDEGTLSRLEEDSESAWLNDRFIESQRLTDGFRWDSSEQSITISDLTARKLIDEIDSHELLSEESDVKGVAYEELLSDVFKDSLGQFFTPRPVVEFMVDIVDPEVDAETGHIDSIIDPGSGTGGFLTEALEKLLEQTDATSDIAKRLPQHIYGIDRSPRMPPIAKTNLMLYAQEGWEPFDNIYQGNSLATETGGIPVTNNESEETVVPFNSFDILLANPPFGATTGGSSENSFAEEVMELSDYVQSVGELNAHEETESLFVKRSVDLLKPGGEMAIVIPKNIIKGSGYRDLQRWLLSNCNIKSVVNLPMSTFRAFDSEIKTVVLHLQKQSDQDQQSQIYFDAARYVGMDDTGRGIQENDLPKIKDQILNGSPGDLEDQETFGVYVDPEQIDLDEGGLDPLYYILDNSALFEEISAGLSEGEESDQYSLSKIRELTTRRRDKIEVGDDGMAYIIFANDVDRPLGEITGLSVETPDEDGDIGSYTVCKPGDVLYYRMRPYLRKAAVVPETLELETGETVNLSDVPLACSSEFIVLEPSAPEENILAYDNNLDYSAEYLWTVLRSNLTLFQVLPTIKGGTRPRVPFDVIMDLEVPIPSKETQEEIVSEYRATQSKIKDYRQIRSDTVSDFKRMHGTQLFGHLGMESMQSLDDGLITLLVEGDILPKSYPHEFY